MTSPSPLPPDVLAEVQGNVYPGFKKPHQAFLFVRFPDGSAAAVRNWLREIKGSVSYADSVQGINARFKERRAANPGREYEHAADLTTVVNIAFSHKGLKQMEAPEWDAFPPAFMRTPHDRAVRAGDAADVLGDWTVGGTEDKEAHAVVILGADVSGDLTTLLGLHEGLVSLFGLEKLDVYRGTALSDAKEHFGFKDDISQPNPVMTEPPLSDETNVLAGEFLLGKPRYPRYGDGPTPLPEPPRPSWAALGSYLVIRKLEQKVALFRQESVTHAAAFATAGVAEMALPDADKLFQAKCIGRWPDGTPLSQRPAPVPPSTPPGPYAVTAGDYSGDDPGFKIPRFAHIRKAYPRDLIVKKTEGGVERIVDHPRNHRLIRRGITYGDPLPAAEEDDGDDLRGIIFAAYQASIAEQFEHIMIKWSNKTDFRGPVTSMAIPVGSPGQDALIGVDDQISFLAEADPKTEGAPPTKAPSIQYPKSLSTSGLLTEVSRSLEQFVVMRGGGYFISPSKTALDILAQDVLA